MKQLRFIRSEHTYADFSTSLSPAVERAMEEGHSESTALLDIFRGGSFTIGVFEDPEKSLDLDYCRNEGIVVRRRLNPGGTIWGPEGSALLAFYLSTRLPWVPFNTIKDAFSVTLRGLEASVRGRFGIEAAYRPLNDVEVDGRKLIATSARLEKNVLTMRLVINVAPTDPAIMRTAIRMAPEKVQDKKIKDVGARFTCLEKELGRKVLPEELEALTRDTVERVFGPDVDLVPAELTETERGYAAEYQNRYTSDAWFYENSEKMRFRDMPVATIRSEGRHKAPAGLIRVTLLIRGNRIHDLIITGDFHPTPYEALRDMEKVMRGKECRSEVIEKEMSKIFERPEVEIPGTVVKDFTQAFVKAFEAAGISVGPDENL
jgi:lipoate-protein ligase A